MPLLRQRNFLRFICLSWLGQKLTAKKILSAGSNSAEANSTAEGPLILLLSHPVLMYSYSNSPWIAGSAFS